MSYISDRSLRTTPTSRETLLEWKGHSRSSGRVPGYSRSSSRSSENNSRNEKSHSRKGVSRVEQRENHDSWSNSRSDSRENRPKDFHLPLRSRSFFSRIGVVPAHQNISASPNRGFYKTRVLSPMLGERQSIAQKGVRAIDAQNSQLEHGPHAAKTSVRAPGLSTDGCEHPFVWYFGAVCRHDFMKVCVGRVRLDAVRVLESPSKFFRDKPREGEAMKWWIFIW